MAQTLLWFGVIVALAALLALPMTAAGNDPSVPLVPAEMRPPCFRDPKTSILGKLWWHSPANGVGTKWSAPVSDHGIDADQAAVSPDSNPQEKSGIAGCASWKT